MKKLLTILCLVLISTSFVFAQGGNEKTTVAQKSNEPVTIDLWYGAAVTEAGPVPSDWVGYQIIKDKLNIDLKLTALPSNDADQDVKIQAAGAANNLPDLFMVSRKVLTNLVKQGLVANVDSYYAQMPNRTAIQYDSDSMKQSTINGHSYGFASPGSIAKNEGLLIRKDWLDKLGLAVPTTADEFFAVCKAFTTQDPDGNGKNDTYGFGGYVEVDATLRGYPGARFFPIMGAFGVDGLWSFDSATAGLNVYKPEFYDFMVYLKQMCDEGVIDPNWLSYKKDDFRAAWKQGKFGIMKEQNAAFAASSNYAPFDKNFPEGSWVICDPFKGPNGDASIGAFDMNFRIYAVSTTADKAGKGDAIARLLEWMSSEEGYFLLGWGVEGVNFVKDANGIPVAGDLGDKAFTGSVGQTVTQLRNMVFYNGDTELASRYPTYITATSGKEMSALKVLREMQSKTWTNNVGAGTMPTANADVKRFYEQSLAEFLTGKTALTQANWAKFITEFNNVGGKTWNDQGVAYMKENNLI
ncbi:MAG: extracellular solute-binding protein [Spirochaetales bacterium]|nr:extracellular solute-binding protein [Spirochaetales bacterium]